MEKLKHLFSTTEAGEYLNISPQTLANYRSTGSTEGINFVKIGGSIRYRKADLDSYLEEHTYNHTGEINGDKWYERWKDYQPGRTGLGWRKSR